MVRAEEPPEPAAARAAAAHPEFAALYESSSSRVLGLCRRTLAVPEEAEDAAAEAFLKAQRAFAGYDPARPFASWVLTIAGRVCLDRLRRRRLERRLFPVPAERAPEAPAPTLSPLAALGRVVGLAGAFVVGAVLLWLLPGMFGSRLEGGAAWLQSLAAGFVVLAVTPIAAVVMAITVVGVPLALLGLVAWVVALYVAKILVADVVGRRLVAASGGERGQLLLALLAGLAVVTLATSLPWIGAPIGFLVVLLGLGLLVARMRSGARLPA